MVPLIIACGLFLGIHFFISGTALRGVIVGRIGEGPYQGLFSLASIGALAWLIYAYSAAPFVPLWDRHVVLDWIAVVVMLPAVVLLVAGLTTRNPTSVGQGKALKDESPAVGIVKLTRHPFLWSVALWGLAHVLVNGDGASLVLFGGFALLALIGPHLIDAKQAKRDPESWERFSAVTSWLPFAAIAQGRTSLSLGEIGWWRLLLGLVLYVLIISGLHLLVFGVSALPV